MRSTGRHRRATEAACSPAGRPAALARLSGCEQRPSLLPRHRPREEVALPEPAAEIAGRIDWYRALAGAGRVHASIEGGLAAAAAPH